MTYGECFGEGKRELIQAGVAEAELDAGLLLEFVCRTDRGALLAHPERAVSPEEQGRYRELIRQRARRIPLQYLTGEQYFMGLPFQVDENVLIPRQDTEILAEEALRNLHDGMEILDLCTGSGCILISLLRYSNECRGVGTDLSGAALRVAEKNAERLLAREGESLSGQRGGSFAFLESNLYERVEGMFDMIVSNPPYIPTGQIPDLMPEVRDHEPRIALNGGGDGLAFYREIIADAGKHLKKGGMLLLEIGWDQAGAVRALMRDGGFVEVRVIRDYAGLDRVVTGVLGFGPF